MSDKKTFDALVDLLRPQMEYRDDRQAFVRGALFNCDVLNQIEWDGSANTFTVHLVHALFKFGDCSGRPAIVMLLEELKSNTGFDVDKSDQIDALVKAYSQLNQQTPPVSQHISLPSAHINQSNDNGTNLNSTGDENNIAARDIHIHNYGNSAPASQPQHTSIGSKYLQESYYDLPTGDLKMRFRALGVLPADLRFEKTILCAIWELSPHEADVYIDTLLTFGLMEEIEEDLYTCSGTVSDFANYLLTIKSRSEFHQFFARYLKVLCDIYRFPSHHSYADDVLNIYLSHIEPLVNHISKDYSTISDNYRYKYSGYASDVSKLLLYVGDYFERRDQDTKAMDYWRKSVNFSQHIQQRYDAIKSLSYIKLYHKKHNNIQETIKCLQESVDYYPLSENQHELYWLKQQQLISGKILYIMCKPLIYFLFRIRKRK